jgi:hypothetical protein
MTNSTKEYLNPTDINIMTRLITVQDLLTRINRGGLSLPILEVINPLIISKQSRFIESILLNLPLNAYYIDATENDNNWKILKGTKRLITIYQYIHLNQYKLEGLDYLEEVEGKYFNELHPKWQRRLKASKLMCHIILNGTPPLLCRKLWYNLTQTSLN